MRHYRYLWRIRSSDSLAALHTNAPRPPLSTATNIAHAAPALLASQKCAEDIHRPVVPKRTAVEMVSAGSQSSIARVVGACFPCLAPYLPAASALPTMIDQKSGIVPREISVVATDAVMKPDPHKTSAVIPRAGARKQGNPVRARVKTVIANNVERLGTACKNAPASLAFQPREQR